MKVSAFAPSSSRAPESRRRRIPGSAGAYLIAALYLGSHLFSLAPSLEDIDSINFALGLREFDPAEHQPHPPGYPVYIGFGRVLLTAVGAVAPDLSADRAEAVALALASALAGGVALVGAVFVFRWLYREPWSEAAGEEAGGRAPGALAVWAAALLAASPLFWMSGLRPMSDMVGLSLALATQGCLLRGLADRRSLVAGAFLAGLAAGVRVQTALLTVPLLCVALVRQRRAGLPWLASRPVVALAAGAIAWVVPLLLATGGIAGYLRAARTQAGEDFAWVDMLWANPTPRRLAFSLYESLVLPWSSVPLAVAVGAAALAGFGLMLLRERRALTMVLVAFAPYTVFHLLFQETFTVRYALPILPLVAFLAVRGVDTLGRFMPAAAAALVLVALFNAVPPAIAYGREPHPAFAAIADMRRLAETSPPAAVTAHFALRRPLQAADTAGLPIVDPPRQYEWLGLVEHWRNGGHGPIWFLADRRRTDLALIDPQSRRDVTRYTWAVGERPEFTGTRPVAVDWYRFEAPGWFAGQGWALTPETGGLARATAKGLDHGPIEAFVRRRAEPLNMVIGVRHLGGSGDPPVLLDVAIDGATLESWRFDRSEGVNSLRIVHLPGGVPPGESPYARLVITARAATDGTPTPAVAVRQFDIQPASGLTYAFGDGWHEEEYDGASGRRWRWTSDRSVLHVVPPQAIELTLRGESPLKYYDTVPILRLTAGDRVLSELRPTADFAWRVRVPADVLAGSNGTVAVESDQVYLPGPAEGTSDERRLGFRVLEWSVLPVRP